MKRKSHFKYPKGKPQTNYPNRHMHHGTKTYWVWAAMRQRCNNPKNKDYKDYGQRGIRVCERWNWFINFLADMGEKPDGLTLDRINNNGNYEPGNCRWATRKQQGENKREYKNSKRRKLLNGKQQ